MLHAMESRWRYPIAILLGLGVGTWIGAALATPMQEKPPVAASPIAVESFRKSRRANSFVIVGLS